MKKLLLCIAASFFIVNTMSAQYFPVIAKCSPAGEYVNAKVSEVIHLTEPTDGSSIVMSVYIYPVKTPIRVYDVLKTRYGEDFVMMYAKLRTKDNASATVEEIYVPMSESAYDRLANEVGSRATVILMPKYGEYEYEF